MGFGGMSTAQLAQLYAGQQQAQQDALAQSQASWLYNTQMQQVQQAQAQQQAQAEQARYAASQAANQANAQTSANFYTAKVIPGLQEQSAVNQHTGASHGTWANIGLANADAVGRAEAAMAGQGAADAAYDRTLRGYSFGNDMSAMYANQIADLQRGYANASAKWARSRDEMDRAQGGLMGAKSSYLAQLGMGGLSYLPTLLKGGTGLLKRFGGAAGGLLGIGKKKTPARSNSFGGISALSAADGLGGGF